MAEEHKPKNIMSFFLCVCLSRLTGAMQLLCAMFLHRRWAILYIYTQYYYVTVSKVYDGLYRKVETEEE